MLTRTATGQLIIELKDDNPEHLVCVMRSMLNIVSNQPEGSNAEDTANVLRFVEELLPTVKQAERMLCSC
jgi:hypothetical protein